MSLGSGLSVAERVLVLVSTAGDAELCSRLREEAGLRCEVCADLDALSRELERGAGVLLLTDDALEAAGPQELSEAVLRQPSWSEFPILLLANHGGDSPVAARAVELLGNVRSSSARCA